MREEETRRRPAAAVAYARRGWAVHPARPGDKRPRLKDRPHQATTGQPAIQAWWARWPEANAGVACGPSGAFAVDLEVKGGADGPARRARPAARPGLGLPEIAGGSELTNLDGNYGRLHDKGMRAAALPAGHEKGRAVRYTLPGAEGTVDNRQRDNKQRLDFVYNAGQRGVQANGE